MIAGPNGAGKTTMVSRFIAHSPLFYEFLNADEIAKGLAPLHPESVALAASKLMIRRLLELLEKKKNFAFETTASGTNYIKHLKDAKLRGFEIYLMFLWLPSPEQATQRVAERVRQGGHFIPEDTIRRRYFSGIKNILKYYLPLADKALIVDNSEEQSKRIVLRKSMNSQIKIEDENTWKKIQEIAR